MKKKISAIIFAFLIATALTSCSATRGNYGGCPTNNKNFFRR